MAGCVYAFVGRGVNHSQSHQVKWLTKVNSMCVVRVCVYMGNQISNSINSRKRLCVCVCVYEYVRELMITRNDDDNNNTVSVGW